MASFTTRVELHGADAEDYDDLHEAMKAAGFKRTLVSDAGTYELPPAEYRYDSESETAAEVRDRAHAAAKTVKPDPAVLVTKSAGRAWVGLKKTK